MLLLLVLLVLLRGIISDRIARGGRRGDGRFGTRLSRRCSRSHRCRRRLKGEGHVETQRFGGQVVESDRLEALLVLALTAILVLILALVLFLVVTTIVILATIAVIIIIGKVGNRGALRLGELGHVLERVGETCGARTPHALVLLLLLLLLLLKKKLLLVLVLLLLLELEVLRLLTLLLRRLLLRRRQRLMVCLRLILVARTGALFGRLECIVDALRPLAIVVAIVTIRLARLVILTALLLLLLVIVIIVVIIVILSAHGRRRIRLVRRK